jgi:type VI protein secretion system component VasK
MDNLVGLYLKTKAAFVALFLLTIIYLVVWLAWLWPTFPYPGVSWYGDPWVNFRQWIILSLLYAIFFVIFSAFRDKWLRDAKREEMGKYGAPASVAEIKKKTIDQMISDAAKEAAEEATKEEKEGGEK